VGCTLFTVFQPLVKLAFTPDGVVQGVAKV